jgi:UDP-2,3-diacylglucosamine hydrolase
MTFPTSSSAQTRDPAFQAQFLSQPLAARIAFAQKAREASQARQSEMKQGDRAQFETVTDVAPSEVDATFARHGVDTMIHGHTHPGDPFAAGRWTRRTRIVLGDWYEQGSVLRVDASGWSLDTLARANDGSKVPTKVGIYRAGARARVDAAPWSAPGLSGRPRWWPWC